jgi:hypothetical protein
MKEQVDLDPNGAIAKAKRQKELEEEARLKRLDEQQGKPTSHEQSFSYNHFASQQEINRLRKKNRRDFSYISMLDPGNPYL